MKHRPSFTKGELWVLAHLTRHFTDYMGGDDRPDHGLGVLRQYRDDNLKAVRENDFLDVDKARPDYVKDLISAMGKLNRMQRKLNY